ncbi:MAG: phage holin, LLH family [Peptostreptococcaceae bacterium]
MNSDLFNFILSVVLLIISFGGGYLIKLLKQDIDVSKFSNYYTIAKQVVMSIEQLYPELDGQSKKQYAVELLLKLTNNKLTSDQANTLIESAVYEIKKLLQNN